VLEFLLRAWITITHPAKPEAGQSTAEYALVMIGAAAIAGLVLMWAGKTDIIGNLFSGVIKKILPG
jgi:hypothetical protein